MSDEARKNQATTVDDGFTDWGDGGDQFVRVIQGELWRFSNEGCWVNADEEKISPQREVVVIEVTRVLQKWLNQMPAETRFLEPGESSPDIELLNEACPQSEWGNDLNDKPRGPWQLQHVVYMVDLETMERFTFATSTVGGSICVRDLKDKVKMMRRFKGPGMFPVVSPSSKHMKTRFGGRQRPDFEIKRWITFDPGGGTALPPASPPPLQPPASRSQDKSGARIVEEPSLRDEMDDSIPF